MELTPGDKEACASSVQAVYRSILIDRAIEQIRNSNPATGEYVLIEWSIDQEYIVMGYLTYYTEEGILNDWGEKMGLTEEDIGKPCEYWEMTLSIEPNGEVVECYTGNYAIDKHPNWQEIISRDGNQSE